MITEYTVWKKIGQKFELDFFSGYEPPFSRFFIEMVVALAQKHQYIDPKLMKYFDVKKDGFVGIVIHCQAYYLRKFTEIADVKYIRNDIKLYVAPTTEASSVIDTLNINAICFDSNACTSCRALFPKEC